MFLKIELIGVLTMLLCSSIQAQPVVLTVDTKHVIRDGADRFVGINLNYIRDDDANRPTSARHLNAALKDMGVRWLRYPGGEKSNFYLWSQPPSATPNPVSLGSYAKFAGQRMDFDQYIATARATHAEPYVVVGYSTQQAAGLIKAEWLKNAISWVRYANIIKHDHVRYWEIGNENWNNNKATPEEMARIVVEFSRAMKAVDPTIQIGSNGNSDNWWSRFLPIAAPALDFISLSLYNCWDWKSYDHFANLPPGTNTVGDVDTALGAILKYASPTDRARLRVIVAETNSKDYSEGGWPGTNTLGHTLVTFDTLGQVMAHPHVLTAMVWTTRWMDDSEAAHSQWYALGPNNQLLPTGRAIALWGEFAQSKMVAVDGASNSISAYATTSADGKKVTVWVLNRSTYAVEDVHIHLQSAHIFSKAALHRLSGTGPDDPNPKWGTAGTALVSGNSVSSVHCPPTSVTVLTLQANP